MNNKLINNCTLIVSSCDSYKDLWRPYFQLKDRFWSDCPFPTILICETETMKIPGVNIFNTGENLSWSEMLKATIIKSKSEYILLSMEDFFLQSKVNNNDILILYNYVISNEVNMLRLIPRPGPDIKNKLFHNIGEISTGADYRVSGQAAFWNAKTLFNLLNDKESLWEFEINATKRSKSLNKFYSVKKPVLTYRHHVIERGKWFVWSALKFKLMGLNLDFKTRKIMNLYETMYWLVNKSIHPLIIAIPKDLRYRIKSILKVFKISY